MGVAHARPVTFDYEKYFFHIQVKGIDFEFEYEGVVTFSEGLLLYHVALDVEKP